MGKLVLHLPDGSTRDVPLARERITIGRRADNDVCLPLPTVSGEHAAIDQRQGGAQHRLPPIGGGGGDVPPCPAPPPPFQPWTALPLPTGYASLRPWTNAPAHRFHSPHPVRETPHLPAW